ncbi:hypothetical protein L484_016925 [Morus notabilis]|uniref:Uncharacterized protein n=1 Tax=Morus notabilis TaxID=981085 RepID=W9S699_9ROSA|nr:hypothetical protein L484_016925 [Morus notabilis]
MHDLDGASTTLINLLLAGGNMARGKTIIDNITEEGKLGDKFVGDGFAIRVPPQFEDIMEPEDFDAGLSLYRDEAKPKTFAARFASPDGTYYFYEFGRGDQHVALVAAVNSGKAIIAGATAPQSKWDDDGMKLRSAANIDFTKHSAASCNIASSFSTVKNNSRAALPPYTSAINVGDLSESKSRASHATAESSQSELVTPAIESERRSGFCRQLR